MKVPHNKITFDDLEVSAVQDVVRSGHWVGGVVQERVENKLSTMFSVQGATCVGSGLSALRLSLLALGVGEGDEVIIPAYSCVALANAVLSAGAIPVAVDVEEKTYNISVDQARDAITAKTKAVIAVNNFGVPADILGLKEFDIPVIEDCSHGFKVNQNHIPEPISGDIAIFSFYATKLIAGGEGGAILSNNKKVINYCRTQRDYTDKEPDGMRLNDKMTDIESALVEVQLDKLSGMLSKRANIASNYSKMLADYNTPAAQNDRVWYRYVLKLLGCADLDSIIEILEKSGVSARKPVENWLGNEIKNHPNASDAFDQVLSLPIYPTLEKEQQDFVINTIKETIK